MCTYITEKTKIYGSAKGANGWVKVDAANVYFDHPYHAQLDHALGIDFVNDAGGSTDRVAVELSAESARRIWFRRAADCFPTNCPESRVPPLHVRPNRYRARGWRRW